MPFRSKGRVDGPEKVAVSLFYTRSQESPVRRHLPLAGALTAISLLLADFAGAGGFEVSSLKTFPMSPRERRASGGATLHDWTGDQRAELMIEYYGSNGQNGGVLRRINRSGDPSRFTFFNFLGFSVDHIDFNGDGIDDILMDGSSVGICQNGRFRIFPVAMPQGRFGLRDIGDIDGDGDMDVVADASGGDQLWIQTDGVLVNVPGRPVPDPSLNEYVATDDLNGDGRVDLVAWRGVETSGYSDFTQTSVLIQGDTQYEERLISIYDQVVAVADLDRDGALDLIETRGLRYNDGSANFNEVEQESRIARDFNGDGWMDLCEIKSDRAIILLGTGSGFEVGATIPLSANEFLSDTAGDIDGDGAADLMIRVFERRGFGVFLGVKIAFNRLPSAVGIGPSADADGDLNADLFFMRGNAIYAVPLDASGRFAGEARLFGRVAGGETVSAIQDLNGDRWADVVVTQADGTVLVRWGPRLVTSRRLSLLQEGESVIGSADFDLDGFHDLVTRRETGGGRVFFGPGLHREQKLPKVLSRVDTVLVAIERTEEAPEGAAFVWDDDGNVRMFERKNGKFARTPSQSFEDEIAGVAILEREGRFAEILKLDEAGHITADGERLFKLAPGDQFVGPR